MLARATPTRFFCPPESPAGVRSANAESDTARNRSSTRVANFGFWQLEHSPQGERHVLGHGHPVEEGIILEEHPHLAAVRGELELVHREDVALVDNDRAGVRNHEAGDHLEKHALAARAGADQPIKAAARDLERHVTEDGVPQALGQVLNPDHEPSKAICRTCYARRG